MKKAIVFGGSGFLGSHVADSLTNSGIQTTIFDISPSPYLSEEQLFIKGDIIDAAAVQKAIQGMDYVYHLAGEADIDSAFLNPKKALELNIQGTINILEACRQMNVERLIFASTIYVYSDAGGIYRASKQSCELIIEEYQKSFGVNYTILRYGSVYGPRADERNFIYKIIKQALITKRIFLEYGEEEKRDFVHVLDAAKMSVDVLQPEYVNSHVILTGYQSITRGELLKMLKEILGGGLQINFRDKLVDRVHGHYRLTPYIFKPTLSKKIVPKNYIELGQGLLSCIEEIYEKNISE